VVDGRATFTVNPAQQGRLLETEIYCSYDLNAVTRFWHRAQVKQAARANYWSVQLPLQAIRML